MLSVPFSLRRWICNKFRIGTYRLDGMQIIADSEPSIKNNINIADIIDWQILMDMGIDLVIIRLRDGRIIKWIDKFDDLISILRSAAPEREVPWEQA
jgi:hypothetical protein